LERKFRTPALPLMSFGTIIGSCYLIITLPQLTKIVFFSWMAFGLIIYFAYSRHNSKWKESGLRGDPLAEAVRESAS
jgi:APA family basic amino acid/polyamine antiporter